MKKGEELIKETKAGGQSALGLEQLVTNLKEKWDALCLLIENLKKKLHLAEQKKKILGDAKRIVTVVTEIEVWIQTMVIEFSKDPKYQLEQIKVIIEL